MLFSSNSELLMNSSSQPLPAYYSEIPPNWGSAGAVYAQKKTLFSLARGEIGGNDRSRSLYVASGGSPEFVNLRNWTIRKVS